MWSYPALVILHPSLQTSDPHPGVRGTLTLPCPHRPHTTPRRLHPQRARLLQNVALCKNSHFQMYLMHTEDCRAFAISAQVKYESSVNWFDNRANHSRISFCIQVNTFLQALFFKGRYFSVQSNCSIEQRTTDILHETYPTMWAFSKDISSETVWTAQRSMDLLVSNIFLQIRRFFSPTMSHPKEIDAFCEEFVRMNTP